MGKQLPIGDYNCAAHPQFLIKHCPHRHGDSPSYEESKQAIIEALSLGMAVDEVDDMDYQKVSDLAAWLASEGIGKVK